MSKPVIPASPDANGHPTFHEQVRELRKHLIERSLIEHGGNRTRAARALGLQRTYLLRLIRELAVQAPKPTRASRSTPHLSPHPGSGPS